MGPVRRHARQGPKRAEQGAAQDDRDAAKAGHDPARRPQDGQGDAPRGRVALSNHQYEQAESIAQEVKGWNLSYGLFEDNPDKVAAAARALRKRDKIRNTTPKEQASQGVYDVLVQESRQLMKIGKLDEAEAKARQAQRMNVVPALTADRAESVLHDIAMARARTSPGAPAPTPAARGRRASWPSARPTSCWPRATRPRPPPSSPRPRSSGSRNSARLTTVRRGRIASGRSGGPEELRPNRPAHRCSRPRPRGVRSPPTSPQPGAGHARGPAAAPPDKPARRRLRTAKPRRRDWPRPTAQGGRAGPARARRPAPAAVPAAADLEPQSPAAAEHPPASKGQQMLAEAKAALHQRQLPGRPAAGRGGQGRQARRRRQADELLAQIGLAEQGGALSLYESALAAMRNGDNARARALLTEVAAAGGSLDESLQAKVQDLLKKLPADDKAPRARPSSATRTR